MTLEGPESERLGPVQLDARRRFEHVCLPLRADLWRFALWLARDRSIAEDVVQETLLRAWRHFGSLTSESAARAWLFTIARRELARIRSRRTLATEDIDDLSAEDEVHLAASPETDDLEDVRRALWHLADSYREPLLLQIDLGLSVKEIGAELGLSQAAVLTRLFRAREQLRASLQNQCGAAETSAPPVRARG